MLVTLARRRAGRTRRGGRNPSCSPIGAAAVEIEHVAVLKGSARAGRAEYGRRLRLQVRAFVAYSRSIRFWTSSAPMPGRSSLKQRCQALAADVAGLAHAIDFPLRLDQPATPDHRPGIDEIHRRHLFLEKLEIDHRDAEPGLASELDPERA